MTVYTVFRTAAERIFAARDYRRSFLRMVSPRRASLSSCRKPGTSLIRRQEASVSVPVHGLRCFDQNGRPKMGVVPDNRRQPPEYRENVVESFPPCSGGVQGLHSASFARPRAAHIQDAHPD